MVGGRPDRKETNNWSFSPDRGPPAPLPRPATPTPRDEERGGRGERFTPTERDRKLYSYTEATLAAGKRNGVGEKRERP